jgi:amino acid adenylation domain-containing protein
VVVDSRGRLDGSELDRRAGLVAAALAAEGMGVGSLVAVHLPRSADAVAAMLGVLRVGGAYLPLDPDQPIARLTGIATDARVAAVVSRSGVTVLDLPAARVLMDALPEATGMVHSRHPASSPEDVAYVIFTSGSTGRPKGCVIEHRAIDNTVAWYIDEFDITAADRLSWYCSPGFDASCIEVWPAVRAGASLHVVPDAERLDPVRLQAWLIANAITVCALPTPMGELLLDLDWSSAPAPALRYLVLGGDRLRRGGQAGLPFRVVNIYGPTEATVCSTVAHLDNGAPGVPPIGRPVPGTWVRVLDEQGRPTPPGIAGELYLGGAQLARGYLTSPDEQASRFLEHPEHGRVYRTGDIVRWRPDGQLDFLHRNDAQVQIRGFRVEPGEVEFHIRALTGVREAAVRAITDAHGEVSLAAYVVPAGADVQPGRLTAALSRELPEYMVPRSWTVLAELPQTDSGKLNRAALPEPVAPGHGRSPMGARQALAPAVTRPATPAEQRLHALWCNELGLSEVGVDDTFFVAGGHSLAAIRMLNRVQAEFGTAVEVLDFLLEPTIRGLARLVDGARVERSGPASRCQARQYEVTVDSDTPSHLTIALRFALHGALDLTALGRAVTDLVARHPALRTRYATVDGVLLQQVLRAEPVPLPVARVAPDELDRAIREWACVAFDLDREPAFRARVFELPTPGRWELALAMHHGISDGSSMAVMVRDLGELYRAARDGSPPDLPVLEADFIDFSNWEREYLSRPETVRAVAAWADEVRAEFVPFELPADRPRGGDSDAGDMHATVLPADLVARLTEYGARHDATPYAVLAAAFAWLLHRLTGGPVIPLIAAVANRGQARFEETVGVFANASWLVIPVAGAESFTDLVGRATRATWRMVSAQSVPSVVRTEALGPDFTENAPRIYLTMHDMVDPVLTLPDVQPAPAREVALPGARGDQSWYLRPSPCGGIELTVEYATRRYDRATVADWVGRFVRLLSALLDRPEGALPTGD